LLVVHVFPLLSRVIVGIEMLYLSRRSESLNLSSLHFETVGA